MRNDSNVHRRLDESGIQNSPRVAEAFDTFVRVVRLLRQACPWDREQTHASIRHLLIEEAYETVEMIDEQNWTGLGKELGDILLHVVFHGVMAEEQGHFDMEELIDAETGKLVIRHPHVFGDTPVEGTEDVLRNWERIKITSGEKKSLLGGVPADLPALLRAHRIQEKVAGVGFDFADSTAAWVKVDEELAEFRAAEDDSDPDKAEEEFGDLLFALVNYARLRGLNAENALRRSNEKFRRRFQQVESGILERGRSLHESSLQEMDALWEDAKRAE